MFFTAGIKDKFLCLVDADLTTATESLHDGARLPYIAMRSSKLMCSSATIYVYQVLRMSSGL
jgi:hypothetical protein